eukprot:TRINITY_DN19932_c0_g1_i1.p1 TRINITY_DN19932_c0_g1~~TRINITY_DN19932_c0_g1_i1.p1  ORF type:complete len:343 (+),score=34.34 TRINITY_DN19932_c0_g1_i1:124-1152(+)
MYKSFALLCALVVCVQSYVFIDDFVEPKPMERLEIGAVRISIDELELPEPGLLVRTGANVLGGTRKIKLTQFSAETDNIISTHVGSTSQLHIMTYSVSQGATAQLDVWYDASIDNSTDVDPSGLGGVDLTQGGQDAMVAIPHSSDLSAPLIVRVYTSATEISQFYVHNLDVAETEGVIIIPFASFVKAPDADSEASFNNVGAVHFVVPVPDGNDKTVDLILDAFATDSICNPSCVNGGQCLSRDNCSCDTAMQCSDVKVMNPIDCGCVCEFECAGGQVQDPDDCSCGCPTECVGGVVMEDCSCHCPACPPPVKCPFGIPDCEGGCGSELNFNFANMQREDEC